MSRTYTALSRSPVSTILSLAALPCAFLACIFLSSCSRSVVQANTTSPEIPVQVATASVEEVPLDLAAVGNVQAIHSVEVKSRIAGRIDRVAFEEGQNVRKGQLLFSIDPATLQRQLAQQRAELDRDLAMEQQARAVVVRDTASLKQSVSEAKIAQALEKEGVLSRQRTDQLATVSETSAAALQSDQAAVNAATGAANADKARLAQTELQVAFTSVVAPMDGRAGAISLKAGSLVRENDNTLVSLIQISPIYVTFGIPEQSLPEVQQLAAAGPLTVDVTTTDGKTTQGQLAFIDNTVDAATGTVKLKATFQNQNQALWPGQFTNVRLRLRTEHNKILVPESSILDGQNGKYVWIINAGIATTAPVTVARTYRPTNGPPQAVIASGINPGRMVVTQGQLRLTPGSKVRVLNLPSPVSAKS